MDVSVMARALLGRCPHWAVPLLGLLLGQVTFAHTAPLIPHGAQSGDLIFRKGTESISKLVRSLDSDQRTNTGGDQCASEFSHVGILIAANDLSAGALSEANAPAAPHENAWLVLHATPSEIEGRTDSVVLDSLTFFTSPALSRGHAVYRIAAADAAQRHAAVTAALAQLGQPFSLTDESGTYCTELPYAAWLSAGVDLDVRFKRLAIFLFAPRDFLFPSALMASPKLEQLSED